MTTTTSIMTGHTSGLPTRRVALGKLIHTIGEVLDVAETPRSAGPLQERMQRARVERKQKLVLASSTLTEVCKEPRPQSREHMATQEVHEIGVRSIAAAVGALQPPPPGPGRPSALVRAQGRDVEALADYCNEHFAELGKLNRGTRQRVCKYLTQFLKQVHAAGHSLEDVDRATLVRIKVDVQTGDWIDDRRPFSPATAEKAWQTMKAFLEWRVDTNEVNVGILRHLKKLVIKPTKEERAVAVADLVALLPDQMLELRELLRRAIRLAPCPHRAAQECRIEHCATAIAARPGQLIQLTVGQVNLDTGVVTIYTTTEAMAAADASGADLSRDGRSKSGHVEIKLNEDGLRWFGAQKRLRVHVMGASDSDPFFVTFSSVQRKADGHLEFKNVRPYTLAALDRWLDRLSDPRLGKNAYPSRWQAERGYLDFTLTPYTFRRNGISYVIVANNGNMEFAQKHIAHHGDISMTQRYARASGSIRNALTARHREELLPLFVHEDANPLLKEMKEQLAAEQQARAQDQALLRDLSIQLAEERAARAQVESRLASMEDLLRSLVGGSPHSPGSKMEGPVQGAEMALHER